MDAGCSNDFVDMGLVPTVVVEALVGLLRRESGLNDVATDEEGVVVELSSEDGWLLLSDKGGLPFAI